MARGLYDCSVALEVFVKKALLLSAVLLFAASTFADTIINNFSGYNDGYYPFGDPRGATQTYGEIFTAPGGINDLNGFSFYMGDSYAPGNIITGAYVATWTGTHAGTLLYSSPQITYDNAGNEEININPGNVLVTPGQQYVIFLSTSEYNGQSMGEAYVTTGDSHPNLNGFAYFNNGNEFGVSIFTPLGRLRLIPRLGCKPQFHDCARTEHANICRRWNCRRPCGSS